MRPSVFLTCGMQRFYPTTGADTERGPPAQAQTVGTLFRSLARLRDG
jgi:hypothetical protein